MKLKKPKISDILFTVLIVLLIIPQTRKTIQLYLNKGLAVFSPSTIDEENRVELSDYNWQLQDLEGNLVNFENSQGKVVLVSFWATWCPPCLAEFPAIQSLYNDYSDIVDFILVTNESPHVVKEFLNNKGYNMKVYHPLSNPPKEFDVSGIPRTFLIDRSGEIVIDKTGASNWDSEKVRVLIEELLR